MQFPFNSLLIIFFSSLVCFLSIKLFIPLLRKELLDKPNLRSAHFNPVPRGGGLFIYLITLISSIISINLSKNYIFEYIPLLVLPLSLISLVDDKHNLSRKIRFIFQIIFSSFAILLLNNYLLEINSYGVFLFIYFIFIFFGVYLINAVNFMDGIDGLIGSTFIVIFSAISIHRGFDNSFLLTLVGALIGFVIWNWNPAKVFLGDVGSISLGAIYFSTIISANSLDQAVIFLLMSLPLISDSLFTLCFRILNGHKFLEPHKLHLYQRLVQSGLSHSKVSLIYICGVTIMAFSSFINIKLMIICGIIEILIGFWLSKKIAILLR